MTISVSSFVALGEQIANFACRSPYVDGVQFDLEPYNKTYADKVNIALAELSRMLEECSSSAHPEGRSVSIFVFADALNPKTGLLEALGKNGYAVVSMYDLEATSYDLGSKPHGPNTLEECVPHRVAAAFRARARADGASFALAIDPGTRGW